MQMSDLRPAGSFAQQYGVKLVGYGPPGMSKTPIVNTMSSCVLLAVEPGMLSMRGSIVPTWQAFTTERIDEFFAWFMGSAEARNFHGCAIDSVSQLAELYLLKMLDQYKDGRQAYGEMSKKVMKILNYLYFMQEKHIYLIAKQEVDDAGKRRPFFPGKDLNVKVPHLYDEITHIDKVQMQGIQGDVLAFRFTPSFDIAARDRSGRLAQFEEPHLDKLFTKIMTGA